MDANHFCDLFAYNFWANRKVWNCLMQLSDEQFNQELDYSFGSLYWQILHVMIVEWWWFHFLAEGVLDFPKPEDLPDRAAIRAKWDETEAYVNAYLARVTLAELEQRVRPDFWEGQGPIKAWQALYQVAHHSTDHRAQILAALHRLGAPTTEQDYLGYLAEQEKQK